jgi:hypothetical protein
VAGVCFAESTEDKTFSIAIVLFKAGANTILCFFRHWFQSVVLVTRKSFQHDSGLCTLSLSGFWLRPRLRVVGSCIRSVVAILPVGSITSVGIRNFYVPGNPGSPDWPTALRRSAFSGFGLVNSSVTRVVFPAVRRASAIVGISHSIALRFLSATSLHSEYHRDLTDARVTTFLLARFCNLIFIGLRFPMCFVAYPHLQSVFSKHLSVRLFFYSLRSISSGCFMPFDSFMHSGFQINFCKLLLRVINFSISGINTYLLFRSSAASPGPVTMISSGEIKLHLFAPLSQVFFWKSLHIIHT